jgi:hypothetical protein
MEEYLCKCNNCGNLYVDLNPQTDAIKRDITFGFPELVYMVDAKEGGPEEYPMCPVCKTDEYLTDEYTDEEYNIAIVKNSVDVSNFGDPVKWQQEQRMDRKI